MHTATIPILTKFSFRTVLRKTNVFARSKVLWACILFTLINISCSVIDFSHDQGMEAYISCNHLIKTFKAARPKPNIILLGSSLMRMPFFLADNLHTDCVSDYDHYCKSHSLQGILRAAGFKDSLVFNFSIDGEMVSDAYLINKKLFQNADHPEWIIYGIGPRDFIDSLLSNETRTPIFESLFTLADIWSKHNSFAMNLNDKLNLTFEKLIFLFDKRKQMQNTCANLYSAFLYSITRRKEVFAPHLKAMPQGIMTEQNINLWDTSMEEYRRRYRIFDEKQLAKQQTFLKELCQNSLKNGSKILLINMPLTKANLSLMGREAYIKYRKSLLIANQFPNVYLVDLQDSKTFPKMLYRDTAHLNANGAHRLSMIISDALKTIGFSSVTPIKLSDYANKKIQTSEGIASWWLARAYFANSTPPDVMVLGSSQLGPLLGADAYVYNKSIDITGDHRSQVLEHDFYGLLNKKWKVFVSALPNTLISDQFFISRALFTRKYKPKLVVLTFSPKDFIDSQRGSFMNTEPFAFFSRFTNNEDHRILSNFVKNNCAVYPEPLNTDSKYFNGISSLTLGKPFERLCPGEITIGSGDGYILRNNKEEYQVRYKSPFAPQADVQFDYLDKLLTYLKKQQIKVVAFDLPLTSTNRKLLPENFWTLYHEHINQICKKNDADFIDIDKDVKGFNDKEFFDQVNLNLKGGLRLTSTLALYSANKFHWRAWGELLNSEKNMF